MILRRVIDHFRKQEWAAIFLDFVIVVVGVLLAFQITTIGERRAERERLERSIANVRLELDENVVRLKTMRDSNMEYIDDMTELLLVIGGKEPDFDASQLNRLLWQTMPVPTALVKKTAYEALISNPDYIYIKPQSLRTEFETWETELDAFNRTRSDELAFRDGYQIPDYIDRHSVAAMLNSGNQEFTSKVPKTNFTNTLEDIVGDRHLENTVATRLAMKAQNIESGNRLIAQSERLIEAIDARNRDK